jgi:pimeloyl-ACP methyl ester carboxylesterase
LPGLSEGKGIVNVRHAAEQYASITRHWLDHPLCPLSRLLVGGWSLGGTIAITLAAMYPDLVSEVVLLDPPPPGVNAMKPDEADRLIPHPRSSPRLNRILQTQLKMNLSLSPLAQLSLWIAQRRVNGSWAAQALVRRGC